MLLEALFVAELLSPSRCIWLVSPWISDIAVIDNSAGTFSALNHVRLGEVRLAEVLSLIALKGATVVIATTPDPHNTTFIGRLEANFERLHVSDRLLVHVDKSDKLHEKSLIGDDFVLDGSMNFTYHGVHLREESIRFENDPSAVRDARVAAQARFGGVLREREI